MFVFFIFAFCPVLTVMWEFAFASENEVDNFRTVLCRIHSWFRQYKIIHIG